MARQDLDWNPAVSLKGPTKRKLQNAVKGCSPRVPIEALEPRVLLSVSAKPLLDPLTVTGNTWTYAATGPGGSATITRTVIGPVTFNGHSAVETDITQQGFSAAQTQFNAYDADGNYVQYGQGDIDTSGSSSSESYSPYRMGVPSSMSAGTTYEYSSTTDESDDSTTTVTDDQELTLVSETPSPLTVPAGTFNTYEETAVETITTDDGIDDPTTNVSTTHIWYAADVGIIQIQSGSITESLSSYKVAGDHLAFTEQPTDTDKGETIDAITVSAEDSHGNLDPNADGSVTLTLNSINGDGKLGGTVTKTLVHGEVTFDTLTVDAGGSYTITATNINNNPLAAPATSNQFTIQVDALSWTGKGDGVNWSDPKNWDANVKPEDGDSLIFSSGAPLTSNNDMTGLSLASIDIQSSGYTIKGNSISITQGLTSETGTNNYNIDTALVGSPKIQATAGNLKINSILSGAGLTLAGSGTVTLTKASTYTGGTTIQGGATIDDAVQSGAFGTAAIAISTGVVTIDNTGTGATQLGNDVTFQNGATLAVDPEIDFQGVITITGQNTLEAVNSGDEADLVDGSIKGTGTLTILGDGKIVLNEALPATVTLVVKSGEVDLFSTLSGAQNGPAQVTVSGGTLSMFANLDGSGGIDVASGTLLAGGSVDYTGNITLEGSEKGTNVFITPNTKVLGTGLLTIAGDPGVVGISYQVPFIRVLPAAGDFTLINNITFLNGANLQTSGNATFSGLITTSGINSWDETNATDTVILQGGVAGTGTLALNAVHAIQVFGDIAATASLLVTGSGEVDMLGNLLKAVNAPAQVTVNGGTLSMFAIMKGTGGIDMAAGALDAGGSAGYSGTITLEQSTQSIHVKVTPNAFDLGTGKIVVNGSAGQEGVSYTTPNIQNISTTGATMQLDNTLTFNSGGSLQIAGNATLTGLITLNGTNSLYEAFATDVLELDGGIAGSGDLSLTSYKTIILKGNVTATAQLSIEGSGEVDIYSNLMGALDGPAQVTVNGGTLSMFADLSGDGGIDVASGKLLSGSAGYAGNITLETAASTLAPATIVAPTATAFLGKGTIIINDAPGKPGVAYTPPQLNAGSGATALNLTNAVTFKGDADLQVQGDVTFAGVVTLSGNNGIDESFDTDNVDLAGGITGTGRLGLISYNVISIHGNVDSTAKVLVSGSGEVDLYADLKGALKDPPQVTVQGGKLQLTSDLSGDGGIDVAWGTLVSGNEGYTGTISLEESSNGPAIVSIDEAAPGLGKGAIALLPYTGDTSLTYTSPQLNSVSANEITVSNAINFGGDFSSLNVSGNLTFSGQITLSGINEIDESNNTDELQLNGGITGTGRISLDSHHQLFVRGIIDATAQILAQGDGEVELDANLKGAVDGPAQVTVNGGTLAMYANLEGDGGIDVEFGTLTASGAVDYKGTITLEQGESGSVTVSVTPNTKELGTGKIVVLGPSATATSFTTPSLINATAGSTLTLNNALTLQDGAGLSAIGDITFSQVITVNGNASIDTNGSGDELALNGGVTGSGRFETGGPGSVTLNGDIAAATSLLLQGDNVNLNANVTGSGAKQVTVNSGVTNILGDFKGSGGVDVTGGTLKSGGATGYTGNVTLEDGGTIKVQGNASPLGSGTLNLLGGTLQNIDTSTVTLSNVVTIGGNVNISSNSARFKFAGSVSLGGAGILDLFGSVAFAGGLTGTGTLIIDTTDLAAAGSNPGYTGDITWDSGTIDVTSDNALGSGQVILKLLDEKDLVQVDSIGDPVMGNPFEVTAGTLVLDGEFTFPNGIKIDAGARIEIKGAGSSVVVTGPLSGGGGVAIDDGGSFSATGDQSGFTGTISNQAGKSVPTLTVADAGGVANGKPFPATYILAGTSGTPSDTLDGVAPTLTYYVGNDASGTGASAAPSQAGTYTVIASFAGSENYAAVVSDPVTFTITSNTQTQSTPTLTVTDAGGVANGKPFPATYTLTGTSGTPSDTLDGVSPTLTYYVGSTASGNGSSTPPSAVGTYTVVASFAGSANYNAVVSDAVTFAITSKTQLQPPTIAAPAKATVAENGLLAFAAANAISVADADANGTAEQLTLSATHGTIDLQSLVGLSVISGANGTGAVTVSGTIADLNAALNGLTYTPASNFSGSDTLKLSIKDNDGQTASKTVAITVQKATTSTLIEPKVRMSVSSHSVVPGQKVTITLDSLDLKRYSPNKRLTYTISFGDGTKQTFVGKFDTSLTHVYQSIGNYTISVTATDQTGHTGRAVTQQISVMRAVVEQSPFNKRQTALFVGGTPGNDVIKLKEAGRNKIAVTVNHISQGTFSTAGPIVIERDGGHDLILYDQDLRKRIFAF